MDAPQRYPLAWPSHRARRRWQDRTKGDFVSGGKAITLAAAADKLERQIEALGGKYPVLSSNVELRLDGKPRADRSPPADPGACVYFELKGKPMAMACDAYTSVQMNIAAIANHIDAVRRQALYATAPTAGSGWVMVPREPTEAMRDAGVLDVRAEVSYEDAVDIWSAMIAAAPTVGER